jgi:hypothetical protein
MSGEPPVRPDVSRFASANPASPTSMSDPTPPADPPDSQRDVVYVGMSPRATGPDAVSRANDFGHDALVTGTTTTYSPGGRPEMR